MLASIRIFCNKVLKFVRTPPEKGVKIDFTLSMQLQQKCIEYNMCFEQYEFYDIIGRVQDRYHKSTNALVQHIFSQAQTEWWNSAGWCGIFAILKIAWYFDPGDTKVLYKSPADLESLKILWQQDIVFDEHELQIWPAITQRMFKDVIVNVYGLGFKQICIKSNFANIKCEICRQHKVRNPECCPLKENSSFKQLTDYRQFYETVGVGLIWCESKVDGIRHAVMFRTNGTKRGIYFEDTGGSNQEPDFLEDVEEFSVLGVFCVSMPPNEQMLNKQLRSSEASS